MSWYKRTVDLGKDVDSLAVYVNKPPKVGSLLRLQLKSGDKRNSSLVDFLVVKVHRKKSKRFIGGNKYLVELKKL